MIEIIPAIDIIDGKCARLQKGDFDTVKYYSSNPVSIAKSFESHGIKRLHLVDLDGAREKRVINLNLLHNIATQTSLKIDFGGGIYSEDDADRVFENGASQIIAGSVAVNNKELVLSWLNKYGKSKIILGADVRSEKIAISAWKQNTNIELLDYLKSYKNHGVKYVLCTDIAKDGLLIGPSFELYKKIKTELPDLYIIASGGVTSISEINELIKLNVDAVIIGKALYENKIKIEDLKVYVC